MADRHEKLCLSIQFDNKDVQFYGLLNSYNNYCELRKWCYKLNLIPLKIMNDIEANPTGRLQLLIDKIQEQLNKTSSNNIKSTFKAILTNIILSEEFKLTEYINEVRPSPNLKVFDIRTTNKISQTNSTLPVYQMQTKNRGVLFFVNMRHFPNRSTGDDYRFGSEHDTFYLISLFRKFGYTIYYYEDLLLSTFLILIDRLIQFHLTDAESLMFVVTSHGHENETIDFFYGEDIRISEILFKFNNLNCSQMVGKPKIFLFPCCRGPKQDFGVPRCISLETDGRPNKTVQPIYTDILICYATIFGFVSYRNRDYGSWFIEAFYRILATNAWELDFERMLYMVTQELSAICADHIEKRKKINPNYQVVFQTPSYVRRDFNKLLYFNPGFVENM